MIVPVYGFVKDYAKEKGIAYNNMDELLQHSKIQALFRARIDTLQQQFAHYEQVKRASEALHAPDRTVQHGAWRADEHAEAETLCSGKELQGAD